MEYRQKQILTYAGLTALCAAVAGALVFVSTISVGDQNGNKGMAAGIAVGCVLFGFLFNLSIVRLYRTYALSRPETMEPYIEEVDTEKDERLRHVQRLDDDPATYDTPDTDGIKLFKSVRMDAVLGTDRLDLLRKKIKKVEAITQEEADKILSLFASEEHAAAAYATIKDTIIIGEVDRPKAPKTKRGNRRGPSNVIEGIDLRASVTH